MNKKETIQVAGKNPICISFISTINPQTATVLLGALTNAINNKNPHDEIHLFLSTPGGNVTEGVAIYNMIRALPVPVCTYNIGTVNSIGNIVFQAGRNRICATASSFMFHGVGFAIQNSRMELKQLTEKIETLKNDQKIIANIMARHTKLKIAAINDLFLNMAYVSADEALQRGITDKVCDINLPRGMPMQQLIFQ